jgi:hypothetical protein
MILVHIATPRQSTSASLLPRIDRPRSPVLPAATGGAYPHSFMSPREQNGRDQLGVVRP